jgi:hypothetical protein
MSDLQHNFQCECGKTCYIQKYSASVKGDKTVYYHPRSTKPLTCECGKILTDIPKPFAGVPSIGEFNMMSKGDKKKMLKERSSAHFEKEIAPVKAAKNAAFMKEALNKD